MGDRLRASAHFAEPHGTAMSNRRIALVKPQDIDYQPAATRNLRAACAGFNDYRRKHDIAVNWSTADVWLQRKKPCIRQSVSTVGGG